MRLLQSIVRSFIIYGPYFSLNVPAWTGVSVKIANISIPAKVSYVLDTVLTVQSVKFLPTIAWFDEERTLFRYKLWTTGTEILNVPLYTGQLVPVGAVIEVWSVLGQPIAQVNEWYLAQTSVTAPNSGVAGNVAISNVTVLGVNAVYPDLPTFFENS